MATRKILIIYVVVIVCLLDSTGLYVLAKYYMYIQVCAHDISITWLISSFHSIYHRLITKHLERTVQCQSECQPFNVSWKGCPHHLKYPLPKQRVPVDSVWLICLTDLSLMLQSLGRDDKPLGNVFIFSHNLTSSERIITILPTGMHSKWPHILD